MKRAVMILLSIYTAAVICPRAGAIEKLKDEAIGIAVPSAVLMEKTTGTLIYEKNAHDKLSPASVTKVMTMLLVVEEIEKGALSEEDMVTASAYAAGMGGSQIFLKEGERMSVRDMLKSAAVSSANDACVALAEHISGTEQAFVKRMNERAAELGMKDTRFSNCSGLFEGDDHLTTAYDIALMSRELISHELIKNYTKIWMDTVRGGEFGLSNTNRLIYYYDGATGLKTGFTSKAMYCLAATAMRDGVEYIAVVMHGATSNERFESAKTLLSYAFANYSLISLRPSGALPPVPVELGRAGAVQPVFDGPETALVERGRAAGLEATLELAEIVKAPVGRGQVLGRYSLRNSGGELIAETAVVAGDDVPMMTKFEIFLSLLREIA